MSGTHPIYTRGNQPHIVINQSCHTSRGCLLIELRLCGRVQGLRWLNLRPASWSEPKLPLCNCMMLAKFSRKASFWLGDTGRRIVKVIKQHQRNAGNILKYLERHKPQNSLHLSSCYYLLSFSGRGHIAVQRFMPLLFFGAYLFTVFRAHLWQKCFCNTTVVFYNFDSNSYGHIKYGCWLVVSTPLENILVSWDDYSQYMENVPNHQPGVNGCHLVPGGARGYSRCPWIGPKSTGLVSKGQAVCAEMKSTPKWPKRNETWF
jgi:hypothetical protein